MLNRRQSLFAGIKALVVSLLVFVGWKSAWKPGYVWRYAPAYDGKLGAAVLYLRGAPGCDLHGPFKRILASEVKPGDVVVNDEERQRSLVKVGPKGYLPFGGRPGGADRRQEAISLDLAAYSLGIVYLWKLTPAEQELAFRSMGV